MMYVPLNQWLKLTAGALKTRFPINKLSQRNRQHHRGRHSNASLAFRADRRNFLATQEELDRGSIKFEFQAHEHLHSIYFPDPDGQEREIAASGSNGRARHPYRI